MDRCGKQIFEGSRYLIEKSNPPSVAGEMQCWEDFSLLAETAGFEPACQVTPAN